MSRSRSGSVSVEYMLLLCSVVTIYAIVGTFLVNFHNQILDRLLDRMLSAAFQLIFG